MLFATQMGASGKSTTIGDGQKDAQDMTVVEKSLERSNIDSPQFIQLLRHRCLLHKATGKGYDTDVWTIEDFHLSEEY